MNKLATLSEALQKWSEGKTVLVSLDITSLKLEDLQKLNEMGAVFSYEAVEESLPILFEEEGKTSQAEKQATKTSNKKQAKKQAGLDTGKITALRNAGWSLQKIADEMGCCAQTVADVLNKESTTVFCGEENKQLGGKK